MKTFIKKLWTEEDGPTAVEYAIMLALIIAAVVGTVTAVGVNTNAFYDNAGQKMQNINNLAP